MISHNYTDWYDVQLFGIPAYGTGQVSYSFTPILFLFILIYYDFTIFIGVYAIKNVPYQVKIFPTDTSCRPHTEKCTAYITKTGKCSFALAGF